MENGKKFLAGGIWQPAFECGADIAALGETDRKEWLVLSMPVGGVRCDARMLELMDADHDGRIRTPEVTAAIDFLKAKNVDFDSLFTAAAEDKAALQAVIVRQKDLALVEPSAEEKKALADWEAEGKTPAVAVFGDGTAAAAAALAAAEPLVEPFFEPPEDMPLVTDAPDVKLPLKAGINPKYAGVISDLAGKCVKPVLGETEELDRCGWMRVKSALAPYRAWVAAKPVMNAGAMAALVEEERLYRYKLGLLEFLENFVNMRRLYDPSELAIFQTGELRIDSRGFRLCFHVDDEAAHSALAGKSKCCVLYVKLTRPAEGAARSICAVVTAGTTGTLYAGRRGVFYDRDGGDWEAVVTKVIEAQVSLSEAFWSPWRKAGETFCGMVKKFLGDRQSAAEATLTAPPSAERPNGAALASSVAAVGIGVGMIGAAFASVMAAVSHMNAGQLLLSVLALIALVSLPSVVLTWFRLRQRDLGAILNASGWAVNRPMRFSMRLAAEFTVCPRKSRFFSRAAAIVLTAVAAVLWYFRFQAV